MKNNYQYKTKSGQTISFELLPIKEELIKSRLFDSFSIQARVANEVVGYAKLIFISSEKAKKLLEPFDFFIYKIYGSTDSVVESYEKNNYKFLLGKLALNELKISSVELEQMPTKTINNLFFEFKEKINNDYKGQFNSFMDYWVNKPQLEIIRVFSNKDDSFIDYSKDNQPKTKRLKINNWQGNGIGISLYEFCAKWCSDRNMVLWASSTRTEDSKRIWNSMEKLPKFTILANEARKYTNLGTISSSTERLTLKTT